MYSAQSPGLDHQFLAEIESACENISHHPDAWPELQVGVRRYRLTRFPYGLIYASADTKIVVLAVAHLHRKPGYWRRRV